MEIGGIMKLQVRAFGLAAFVSLVLSSGAFAGNRYLVVMKSAQSYNTANVALSHKVDGFVGFGFGSNFAKYSNVKANVVNSLDRINTLVVDADDAEIAKLQNNSDVAMIEKEVFHPAPKPMKGFVSFSKKGKQSFNTSFDSKMGMPWGIAAVKAHEAWAASGNKGAGARVLVLDTGIDAEHPSLKANFEKGQDFTGESDGSDFSDKVGHGTHCSGTIAGVADASGFSGVAPEAKLLMGRVCSEAGCSNISIAQGINWGIQENVDVISMSLGGMWSTPAERSAVAAADAAGVTIVAASGNSGTPQVSYPAALPTVIAVGAINVKLEKADFSQWGPELAIVAPGVDVISSVPQGTGRESEVFVTMNGQRTKVISTTFQGAKELSQAADIELMDAGLGKPEDFAGKDFTGKYALISRGEIAFADKAKNALAAHAAGAIIYNNAPGLIHGALTQDGSTLDIAVALVEQATGEALKAELTAGHQATASITTLRTDYASFDGTSMATPHVAGVAALVKAANKALKPSEVKDIFKTTAVQLAGANNQNQLGSGLVNAEAAVNKALGK
ncbi:MAG: S8 family serine peptidase [Bdellovibrionales bacterium]|nr:S8 family serine peptidase [Bdellovibrionales bacterium]